MAHRAPAVADLVLVRRLRTFTPQHSNSMFLTLLLVTFAVATTVSVIVATAFSKPVQRILNRIIADEISSAWQRYLMFALYVVGISSGVRIWDLEKYITKPAHKDAEIIILTRDRWILEVYRTVIETLQGLAWVLLLFFIIALIAFVIVRVFELWKGKHQPTSVA
jgi:large-conductance mechanosensitive channel